MVIFTLFILAHFWTSLFFHSFFLHRYSTHRQFTMNKTSEKIFFILTFIFQGPAFLDPVAYAKMHLQHHEHSDTKDDPHSPLNFSPKNFKLRLIGAISTMMWKTKIIFVEIRSGASAIAKMYSERYFPVWKSLQSFANSTLSIVVMAIIYTYVFSLIVPYTWCWIFLPIMLLNGPVQGAIVNWCGHMYGKRNYNLNDNSKNTPFAPLMLGELYQNNHHKFPDDPKFSKTKYEIDPIYFVIRIFNYLGIIKLK